MTHQTKIRLLGVGTAFAGIAAIAAMALSQQPFTPISADVNKRLVKLFGAGGFKGLPHYGTGILVSEKGFILTCNNHILSTTDLRVHLYDGRFYQARVIAREPELDLALIRIESDVDFLPHYDIAKAAAQPLAQPGDWILALSNQFNIAVRDEPMTVQRGVIAAHAELRGRRGIFEAPYTGEAYFLDVIANNPGAAGGALVNRKGELLGIIGRELKNTLTDTWINYAVPVQAKVEILREDKLLKMDVVTFVKEAMAGNYKQSEKRAKVDRGAYHGIVLVPNAISVTPPYVEEVMPDSPAAKAGLRPDDLIVYIDGELVNSIKVFREIMKQSGPGTEVKLDVQRANRLISVKMKLAEQPKLKTAK